MSKKAALAHGFAPPPRDDAHSGDFTAARDAINTQRLPLRRSLRS